MAIAGIFQDLGFYSELSIALLLLVLFSRVKWINRLYQRPLVKWPINIFGFMWYFAYTVPAMYNSWYVDRQLPLVLIRTTDAHSAHLLAYGIITVLSILTFLHPRVSFVRSILFTGGVVGIHEFLWNWFYLPSCYNGICTWQEATINKAGFSQYVDGQLITGMLIATLWYFYRKEFRAILGNLWAWLGFMVVWFAEGYQITLDVRITGAISTWYQDPAVNSLEIGGVAILMILAMQGYLKVHPLRTNLYFIRLKAAIKARRESNRLRAFRLFWKGIEFADNS